MLAALLALAQQPAGASMDLDALTAPASARPVGCELSPSSAVTPPDGRTTVGLWGSLPIASNPWRGTNPLTIAAILDRVGGSSELPDGPPPTARQLPRYRMYQVDEVAEAYVAVYSTPAGDLHTVYAVRFKQAGRAADLDAATRSGFHIVSGDTFIEVDGGGSCGEAVVAHIKQLIGRR